MPIATRFRIVVAALAALAAVSGCRLGTRFTETEWRPKLQASPEDVTLDTYTAALDPWSDRYVLEFRDGAAAEPRLVLEIDKSIPDGDGLDGATYLKAWRYDSKGRSPLTPQTSRLKGGKLAFQRLPEERAQGSYDLLFTAPEDGSLLFGELTELQLRGTFRIILSPPRSR